MSGGPIEPVIGDSMIKGRRLVMELEVGDALTRERASWDLAKMAQDKMPVPFALGQLIESLGDPSKEVRENAAWALGEMAGLGIGSWEGVDRLIGTLEDVESSVRGVAAWAIGRLAERMGLVRDDSMEALRRLADDPSGQVRAGASYAMKRVMEASMAP